MGPTEIAAGLGRIAAVLGGLLLAVPASAAPQVPQREVARPIDFSTSQDDNLFSVLRSQEQIHEYEAALAELANGEHAVAVERLHRLLLTESGGVVPVGPGRYLGLRLAVVTAMGNLPPAAAVAYEDLVRREAGVLAADVPSLAPEQLLVVAERFPAATLGRRARLRLGDLALERGDGLTAAGHFRLALDATAIGSTEERRAAERLQLANLLLEPGAARADASVGRLDALGDDLLSVLATDGDADRQLAIGGGGSGRTPMLAPAGRPEALWSEDVVAPFFDVRQIGQYAMHAVGDLDGIFVNTGHEVIQFDPLRRAVAWASASPMRDESNDYRESVNHDTMLACALGDDVVVATLQVPDKTVNVDFQAGLRIMWKIPQRRLFAFSRQTGKLLWSHFDELDGARTRRFRGHDACSSPLLLGDTVFAPTHDRSGAIQFSIGAYDAATGQPKWRRLICSSQQDVNMFGNARTEFTASPMCHAGGLLFGSSNLGVAYALEATTGRIRWITAYEVVRMPRAMLHSQADRPVYFANNPPIVVAGVACCTPLDSQFVLGLDVEDGRVHWRLPAEATVDGVDHRVLWLPGAIGDEFLLAGAGCIAVKARGTDPSSEVAAVRSLVRPDQLGDRRDSRLPPRPAVTADRLWVPRADRVLAFDMTGQLVETLRLPRYQPGNLLFVGGIAVSLRQRSFEVLADPAALQARVEAQVERTPDDPAALLRLASLRRALLPADAEAAAEEAVQQLYRRGLAACVRANLPKSHPLRAALQAELFDHAFLVARRVVVDDERKGLELLAQARDVAPSTAQWVDVQALVLERCEGDAARFAVELRRLAEEAPEGTFPAGDGIPVATYVLWQTARREASPAGAVASWQRLIEEHAEVVLPDGPAADVAQRAIETLRQRHGSACYAPIAVRADAALAQAGEDRLALESVAARFPNSSAASTARLRLLDVAVRAGDLGVAAAVLAEAAVAGVPSPGILRRVLVAAEQRGNLALAAAMAARLQGHLGVRSDWPEDAGATFGDVLAARPAAPLPAPASLSLPSQDLAFLPTREFLLLVRAHLAPGFQPRSDVPMFVGSGNELRAIDVHAPTRDKPVLYRLPYEYLEHVLVCGTTVVVPDMNRVHAVDYRTGDVRWELPNPRQRNFESLGLQDGVLLLVVQPKSATGNSECWGVEPLTGAVLFTQSLAPPQLRPKAIPGALLRGSIHENGGFQVDRLDAVTGSVRSTTSLPAGSMHDLLHLSPESIAARHYPQSLCADEQRLYLPVEAAGGGGPEVLAVDLGGQVVWRWRGRAGGVLAMFALRGDRLVVAEVCEQQPGRILVLQTRDGQPVREVELGSDATILNWERSWLANPAPPIVAVESFADAGRRQRQLICYGVDDERATFVVALGSEDGDILQAPQFGADFVTFGTRPRRGAGSVRLYALSLADRSGRLRDGAKFRRLDLVANRDGMASLGAYTVVTGTQGLMLLGSPVEPAIGPPTEKR